LRIDAQQQCDRPTDPTSRIRPTPAPFAKSTTWGAWSKIRRFGAGRADAMPRKIDGPGAGPSPPYTSIALDRTRQGRAVAVVGVLRRDKVEILRNEPADERSSVEARAIKCKMINTTCIARR
jgi:hypothetical protein